LNKLVVLIITSILIVGIVPALYAEQDSITKTLNLGINQIFFRDVTNTLPQTATINLDGMIPPGQDVIVTVENPDENLDFEAIGEVTVLATTPSGFNKMVILFETENDSDVFSGTTNLDNVQCVEELTLLYTQPPMGVGRFKAILVVNDPGSGVKISDEQFTDDELAGVNTSFRPVTHPVKLELLGGATLDLTSPPVITLSYANAALQTGDEPSQLNMYYKPGPITFGGIEIALGWEIVRDFRLADGSSFDEAGKTITSDVANTEFGMLGKQIFGPFFGITTTEGEFMLAFDKVLGGGGAGGGLVRPGLISESSSTIECQPVGGKLIPLDTTMVLVAGTQITAAWMIPVIVSGIGFAIVIARKF